MRKWYDFWAPLYCVYCQKESEESVCKKCWKQFLSYQIVSNIDKEIQCCKKCSHRYITSSKECLFCKSRFLFFDHLYALYDYNSFTKKLLLEWKYQNRADIGILFVPDIIRLIKQIQPDRIGYIVSGKQGKNYRSYEVLEGLIKEISRKMDIPYGGDIYKIKKKKQSQNKQDDRFFTTLFSFGLTNNFKLINKYLIIEDIVTTGATINEVSRLLKENGMKTVDVISIFLEEIQEDSLWNPL